MRQETLKEFEAFLRKKIPELRVSYKDRSSVHKILGFLLKPVNPGYMTDFVTTLRSDVAFPSEKDYLSRPQRSFNVLSHEFVHACDHRKSPLWFTLSYLFPQILCFIPLVVFGVLAGWKAVLLALPLVVYVAACAVARWRVVSIILLVLGLLGALGLSWFMVGWTSLWLLGGLLCLGPWPSPGRTHWEKRGYAMSLALYQWLGYPLTERLKTYMENHFVTSQYYFMCWSRKKIRTYIDQTLNAARLGRIQDHFPWDVVYDFLRSHRLVK
jgi:hypothetical protein